MITLRETSESAGMNSEQTSDAPMIEAKPVLEVYDVNTGQGIGFIHRWNNGSITATLNIRRPNIWFREIKCCEIPVPHEEIV